MKRKKLSTYLPFVFMFFFILFLHFYMKFGGDDIWFSKQISSLTHGNYICSRYNIWSSRIIIESILIIITKLNINVWRVIDSFMYVAATFIAIKLVNRNNKKIINYIGCLIFMLYPYFDLSSAGWGATTTNYLWCFSLGMISFLPLINNYQDNSNSKTLYLISILGLFYATNQEQMCAIILGFNILYLINTLLKKEKISKYNIICLLISIASLIFIMTCPGNTIRTQKEIKKWFPEFSKYGILQKLYLGIVSTANIIISNKIVLFLFVLCLAYATYIYSKKTYTKVIAVSNFIVVSSVTILKTLLVDIFPYIKNAYNVLEYQGIPNITDKYSLIPLFFSILLVGNIIFMLLVVFKKNQMLPIFIFLAGICSRLIIGFSPTVFVSSSRTAFYLYMSLIIVTIFIIDKLYEEEKISNKTIISLAALVLSTVIFNYINIFIYI